MKISYKEIVTEDGELMVTAAPDEAVQSSFDTPVKNYRIMEGMGVTFHCKMAGMPLPKVLNLSSDYLLSCMKDSLPLTCPHSGLINVFPVAPDCLVQRRPKDPTRGPVPDGGPARWTGQSSSGCGSA